MLLFLNLVSKTINHRTISDHELKYVSFKNNNIILYYINGQEQFSSYAFLCLFTIMNVNFNWVE